MYRNNKNKSYLNHWYDWPNSIEKEEEFYMICKLVEDMIKEIVPREIEKYKEKLLIDIEPRINGAVLNSAAMRQEVIRQINEELK